MTAVTNTVGSYRLQATWMVGDQLELGLTGRLQAWHPEAGGKAVTLIFLQAEMERTSLMRTEVRLREGFTRLEKKGRQSRMKPVPSRSS